jgi:hypothetical protein
MLRAWAEALAGVVGGAGAAALQGFHGSDVRLPDMAASDPGATGSAAPQAVDLNGETQRAPVHVALQRILSEAPRSNMPRVQGVALDNDAAYTLMQGPSSTAQAPQPGAAAPTSLQPGAGAASLFAGDTRDAQANLMYRWDRFRSTVAQP